jgi:AraC-like DNA-binding protein
MHSAGTRRLDQGDAQVAMVATAGLLPFLAEIGADADRIFGPVGLDAARLSAASEGTVALASYVEIMEQAARHSGCDTFGLRYGRQFPASCHGLVGDVALSAPTIGLALRRFVDLFPLHQEATQMSLRPDGGLLRLEYRIGDWRIYDRRQDAELTIAMLKNVLRHAYGPDFRAEEIHFEHPEPADSSEHAASFDAPVFFGQRTNAISFRPGDLGRAMPGADARVFSRLMAQVSCRRLPWGKTPLSERMRAEIRSRLADGYPAIEDVAEALGVARWTLQRRLAVSGLTYSDEVQEVRRVLALSYLGFPHLSISTIAQLLGYAELSPFSRACKRWFGTSPEQVRMAGATLERSRWGREEWRAHAVRLASTGHDP